MMRQRHSKGLELFYLCIVSLILTGCVGSGRGNIGQMSTYSIPVQEAEWIREGEPIEFEGQLWYPQDTVDLLLDAEVSLLGEYREVQFFVEKRDVRPYNRLYTKFGRTQFRLYEKRAGDD